MDVVNLFDDFLSLVEEKIESSGMWREYPVDLLTFFESDRFLKETPYEGKQTELLETLNQIVWWKLTGDERFCVEDLREILEAVVMFGKGCKSGDTKIFDPVTGKMHTFTELSVHSQTLNVKSLDCKTQKLVDSCTTGVVEVGEGDIYEIVTNSGRRTKVYPEHVFLTRKYTGSNSKGLYRGTEWKRVREMRIGDYVAVSTAPITFNGTILPKNELKLVGYVLGDGNVSDLWGCSFYASNKDVENDYCSVLRSFGVEPKYHEYGNEKRPDRNCVMINSPLTTCESRHAGGNPVTNVLRKYDLQGKNAYEKRIPREFFDLDVDCLATFFSTLFATDGWVCMINNRIPQIGYCSVNRDFAEDIQLLLNKIGIYSIIDEKKTDSKYGKAYQLTINSEIDFLKFYDMIKIVGKEEKHKAICDFIRSNRDVNRRSNGKVLDTEIRFERIKEIKYVGVDKYYDLTVDTYANYASDGFIDHNSGKDFLVSGFMAYMAYLLCCIRDPHEYFHFGQDEPIDLINVAINSNQANEVFFKKLKARLRNCKWFTEVKHRHPVSYNEFQVTRNKIRFYKNITCHSAHSEAEAYEGFNPLIIIFDEYGGYTHENAKNGYDILKTSAATRYNSKYLMIFISYPRSENCPMYLKYKEALADTSGTMWAMIGATWEVNLKVSKETFKKNAVVI
ncbi:MAG: hypothetical protein GX905_05355 [Bacteroidales bacterium]|nr:hypothetical protein [Bacteroidales bacterium]